MAVRCYIANIPGQSEAGESSGWPIRGQLTNSTLWQPSHTFRNRTVNRKWCSLKWCSLIEVFCTVLKTAPFPVNSSTNTMRVKDIKSQWEPLACVTVQSKLRHHEFVTCGERDHIMSPESVTPLLLQQELKKCQCVFIYSILPVQTLV